jgi:hypothetical protein
MKPEEKLEVIEKELLQLTAQQLELEEAQPLYRWLLSDIKLKAITTQIARLEKQQGRLYDILQVL